MLFTKDPDFYNQFDFKCDFLFKNRDENFQVILKEMFEYIEFDKGDKLFYEDGIPTGVFFLEKGKAKKYKTVLDDSQQIFYIYKGGDLMGYHALLSDERYQDTCEAMEHCQIQFLSQDNFMWLLHEYPELQMEVIKNISHEFGVLANTIGVLAQKSQDIRLAINLLILSNRFKNEFDGGVKISRGDLANIVGTSKESLSRSLKELRELKLINIEKKIIYINNVKQLFEFIA